MADANPQMRALLSNPAALRSMLPSPFGGWPESSSMGAGDSRLLLVPEPRRPLGSLFLNMCIGPLAADI